MTFPTSNELYSQVAALSANTAASAATVAVAAANSAQYDAISANSASEAATNAATIAGAMTNFVATLAEGVASYPVGSYFSSAETGQLRIYMRISSSPFYQDQGDLVAPLTRKMVGQGSTAPIFTLSSGEMYNNGSGMVPRVPIQGLYNVQDEDGTIHMSFWPDLDGDGDYDADIWFKSNAYLASTSSFHFRFGDNTSLNGTGFGERGRIRMGCTGSAAGVGTTNVNFIQSGVNYSGTVFNDLAIGKYGSSDWWTYWKQDTGHMGVGTSDVRTRFHVYGGASQNALVESSAATSKLGFRASSQTNDTTATIGVDSGGRLVACGQGVDIFKLGSTSMQAGSDNVYTLGSGSFRWSTVYAGTGTINTSDERAKQDIEGIPDEWLDAWGDVEWSRFKFRDAVEIKGKDARWHVGLIAQRVYDVFADHGIDAFELGLVCFDEWSAETEDGISTLEAGNRWGIRYDQAFVMEAAWTRRALSRLSKRKV